VQIQQSQFLKPAGGLGSAQSCEKQKLNLIATLHVDSGALSSRLFLTAAVFVARKGCCRHQVPFCVLAQAEVFNLYDLFALLNNIGVQHLFGQRQE